MNYYEHHLGDWIKKTAHLSAMQEGIYRRLLDRYYITEQPLPADFEQCCRLARANGRHEKQAVRDVLREFFPMVQGFHHNSRADEEIGKFHGKSAKAKASANARWEREKTEAVTNNDDATASEAHGAAHMRSHSEGNATRARPQSPVPSPQSMRPVVEAVGAVEPKPRAVRSAKKCPAEFEVTAEMREWAESKVPGIDIGYETEKFQDHTFGTARSDWPATWRAWMRKAFERIGGTRSKVAVPEPDWRREQRERTQQAAPYAAANRAPQRHIFDPDQPEENHELPRPQTPSR